MSKCFFLFPCRFNPQAPHLGRPCWRQLLRRWSLLGGKDALSPQGGAISFERRKKKSLELVRVSSGSWGWGVHPPSAGVQQPHGPQAPGHVSSLSLVHWARFSRRTRVWSVPLFLLTDPSPTFLWIKVKGCCGEISYVVKTMHSCDKLRLLMKLCKMDSSETYKILHS